MWFRLVRRSPGLDPPHSYSKLLYYTNHTLTLMCRLQDFVFAAVRPLDQRPLEINVFLTHHKE